MIAHTDLWIVSTPLDTMVSAASLLMTCFSMRLDASVAGWWDRRDALRPTSQGHVGLPPIQSRSTLHEEKRKNSRKKACGQ